QADLAVGIVTAEILEPVVIDAEHLLRRVMIVQTGGGAEDAEDDLRLHAVQLHVLDPEVWIGRPPRTLLAVLVQPDRGHLVDAVVLAGNQLLAARAHAPDQAERGAVLAGPVGPVGAVDDVRHAIAQRCRGVRREQVVGDPRHVDMAVSGDPGIVHRALLSRMLRCSSYYNTERTSPPSTRIVVPVM